MDRIFAGLLLLFTASTITFDASSKLSSCSNTYVQQLNEILLTPSVNSRIFNKLCSKDILQANL